MLQALSTLDFLDDGAPVIDVRSPSEFFRGHIPGAHSMALFSDEERAVVGTLYKQRGRDAAVLEGVRFVGPRMAQIVEMAQAIAPDGRIRVHCWRGGERSSSVAWLLSKAGFKKVLTLNGGYKAFRQHVLGRFKMDLDLRILGGFTGSGKTQLLQSLHMTGEQVIDLEALACHKGSAFGALGQPPQPTTEHFENLLWAALRRTDPSRPLWVEDESLMIGKVRIPEDFYHRMRNAPLLFIDVPFDIRAERLVREYGCHSPDDLAASITRIARRIGPQHAKHALDALAADDLLTVAMITLKYYDKAYLRGLSERDPARITRIPLDPIQFAQFPQRMKDHVLTSS